MRTVLPTCLFAIFFLPVFLSAQKEEINLTIEAPTPLQYVINLSQSLAYTRKDKPKSPVTVEINQFKDLKLPVFNPESSKLLLEIQLTSTGAVTLDGAKNLSLNIKTTGAFGNLDNNQTIKFRRNRDYKETVEVNISDRGEGSVSITFLSLDSQHFREEIQKYTYKVYAIDQAAYLGNLSQNTVETSADLVRENARVYDLFKHFLNFPKEFQTQSGNASTGYNYNSVITVLRSSEDAIRSCYQNMSSPPQSLGKAVNLFKVFGQPELAGLSQTRSYYGEAVTQLGRAEDEFFKQSDNETSILRLEDRANEYQKLFCELRGYNCRYKKKYSAQIENLIEQWANGSGNKSDYCETWRSEIRISAYYDSHDKDRRFVEAAKKCDSDPCSGAANYSRIKNIETLVRLLASCRENKCGEETCREIEEKINQLNCLQQLARAKAETNLGEKRSLLGQIIQNAACSEAIAEAKKLLEGIQPLKIIKEEGPETGRNEITGGKLLIFTLYFDSGKDIRLQLIDSLLAEPILAEGHVKLNWVEKDRILKIQVEDREEDYQLVFGSESTGEEVPYQLSKKKFAAEISPVQNRIIIKLFNGTSPYYARFLNPDTGKSFTVKLNGQIDTLVTDKLAQNYSGAFDLMVLDGNGKEGFKDAYSLTLKPGFQLQIWMLLLLPLVLIIAFIGYRNLFPLDS